MLLLQKIAIFTVYETTPNYGLQQPNNCLTDTHSMFFGGFPQTTGRCFPLPNCPYITLSNMRYKENKGMQS